MDPEPHRCPPWCHECPHMPDGFMPWCHAGDFHGIGGCCCSHEDPHLDVNTVERANWFAAERLREVRRMGIRPLDELTRRRRAR